MTIQLDKRDRGILAALRALGNDWHSRADIAGKLRQKQLEAEDLVSIEYLIRHGQLEITKVSAGRSRNTLITQETNGSQPASEPKEADQGDDPGYDQEFVPPQQMPKPPAYPKTGTPADEAETPRRTITQIVASAKSEAGKKALVLHLGELTLKGLPQSEIHDRLSEYAEVISSLSTAVHDIVDEAPTEPQEQPKLDAAFTDDELLLIYKMRQAEKDEEDTCPGWVGGVRVNASVTHFHMKYAIKAAARLVLDDTAPFYFDGEGKRESDYFGDRFWNIVAGIAENMVALTDRLTELYNIDQLKNLNELD